MVEKKTIHYSDEVLQKLSNVPFWIRDLRTLHSEVLSLLDAYRVCNLNTAALVRTR
jgi:hypothetical protein